MITPIQLQLGATVRILRERRAWSQEDLAEAAGLHRTYVSQLERGLRNPTLDVMVRLASAFDVELRDLFDGCS